MHQSPRAGSLIWLVQEGRIRTVFATSPCESISSIPSETSKSWIWIVLASHAPIPINLPRFIKKIRDCLFHMRSTYFQDNRYSNHWVTSWNSKNKNENSRGIWTPLWAFLRFSRHCFRPRLSKLTGITTTFKQLFSDYYTKFKWKCYKNLLINFSYSRIFGYFLCGVLQHGHLNIICLWIIPCLSTQYLLISS